MSARRNGLVVSAASLIGAAAFAAAFLLGSGTAPDEQDASSARQESSSAAFVAARASAWSTGLARGLVAGTAAGERQGLRKGGRLGETAALAATTKSGGPRSESEREIGYEGGGDIPGSGGTLVVGDSLEVLSSPYLERYLPSVPLTINVEGGYSSLQIFELFEQSYDPSHSVIVFDAGTNDNPAYPEILAARLRAVARIAGDRCMVVPTIHGLTVDGIDSTDKNRVVESFAASRPGTQVPDWARAVAKHPELMQSDDLHPIPEGAAFRARLIARGVEACLASGSSG